MALPTHPGRFDPSTGEGEERSGERRQWEETEVLSWVQGPCLVTSIESSAHGRRSAAVPQLQPIGLT